MCQGLNSALILLPLYKFFALRGFPSFSDFPSQQKPAFDLFCFFYLMSTLPFLQSTDIASIIIYYYCYNFIINSQSIVMNLQSVHFPV